MSRLVPYADEDGIVFERPPRAGLWTGGVDQIETTAARFAFAPYTGDLNGLYRLYACDGSLLYIGITNDPLRRWRQHASDKEWWYEVDVITLTPFGTLDTARLVERQAIRGERPCYNVMHSRRSRRG
jgi:hypothetical protein